MNLSVNEVQMLAQKAARGGGAYPAQAAHFGRALVCHLVHARPVDEIIAALTALPDGPLQTLPITYTNQPGDLARSYTDAADMPIPERLTCPQDLLALMNELAQRTYVPATEESRVAGAGAGLTDND